MEKKPIDKTKYKYLAVIGRIPFRENVCLLYVDMTTTQAQKKFEKDLYRDEEQGAKKETIEREGVATYIDYVLVSDSPITEKVGLWG